jgi:hypothetical protein
LLYYKKQIKYLANTAVQKTNVFKIKDYLLFKKDKTLKLNGLLTSKYRRKYVQVVVVQRGVRYAYGNIEHTANLDIMRAFIKML